MIGGRPDLQVRPTRMHIAFFNRSFYPDTTATSQLLTDLCEDLIREHGYRVSVVAGVPLLPAAATASVSLPLPACALAVARTWTAA